MIKIKTFRAKNLQLALAMVREELGPDAAVLSTRDVRGGLFGLGGKQVEVTASSSIQVPSRFSHEEDESITDWQPSVERTRAGERYAETPSSTSRDYTLHEPTVARRQTDRLESMAQEARQRSHASPHVEIMNEMLHSGMDPAWARHLLHLVEQSLSADQWQDAMMVRGKLTQWVQSQLAVAPPIQLPVRPQPYVVAMVGPTGVGKTTTLAKLAAAFTLNEKVQVGLITIDTFRVGAVEQLRKYAEIMHLPMAVVESEDQMGRAMAHLAGCRLIFIDTAGRTPRDTSQLDILKGMLNKAQVDETHLVLSATTSAGSFQDAFHRYAAVRPNRMVLSKLDEVRGLGELFPMLRQSQVPIAYVTIGQQVPQDIEIASKTALASSMLGHR